MNFQGILVGIGRQKVGLVLPVMFFVITIPTATALVFFTDLGPFGYFLGIFIGLAIRCFAPIPIATCWINWNKIVSVDNMAPVKETSIEDLANQSTYTHITRARIKLWARSVPGKEI